MCSFCKDIKFDGEDTPTAEYCVECAALPQVAQKLREHVSQCKASKGKLVRLCNVSRGISRGISRVYRDISRYIAVYRGISQYIAGISRYIAVYRAVYRDIPWYITISC